MINYKIYTKQGDLSKIEYEYENALHYVKQEVDKFVIIVDGMSGCGTVLYSRLPYLPSVLREAVILTVDDIKTSDKFITIKTLKYEGHIYYLQIVNGFYKHFYRLD